MRNGSAEQIGTPTDLYDRPSHEFIADFIGESNFIQGVVESLGEEVAVRVSDKMTVYARPRAFPKYDLDVGTRVTIAVRPAEIDFLSNLVTSRNCFSGNIEAIAFEGQLYRYYIRLSGEVSVCLSKLYHSEMPNKYKIGKNVFVHWDPEACQIL